MLDRPEGYTLQANFIVKIMSKTTTDQALAALSHGYQMFESQYEERLAATPLSRTTARGISLSRKFPELPFSPHMLSRMWGLFEELAMFSNELEVERDNVLFVYFVVGLNDAKLRGRPLTATDAERAMDKGKAVVARLIQEAKIERLTLLSAPVPSARGFLRPAGGLLPTPGKDTTFQEMDMNHADMAIEILQKTKDGDALRPSDLALVEYAVNSRLSDRGIELFRALHAQVLAGEYSPLDYTSLAPHLTKANDGTVSWKRIPVEHYSFPFERRAEEQEAAATLAARCLHLESVGIPVNGRNVLCEACYTAPADSPWRKALASYYSLMQKDDGTTIALFSSAGNDRSIALSSADGQAAVAEHGECYDAFHHYQQLGFKAKSCNVSYERVAELLTAIGLTPEAMEAALAAQGL